MLLMLKYSLSQMELNSLYAILVPSSTDNPTILTALNIPYPESWNIVLELPRHQWGYMPYYFIVSNSGALYIWDYRYDILYFQISEYEWETRPCIGQPLIDADECIHLVWESFWESYIYYFSTDTLFTFDVVDTLPEYPQFKCLASTVDGSEVSAIFIQDTTLYKYSAQSGNPIDFDTPEIFYFERPSYPDCFSGISDCVLDNESNICMVFIVSSVQGYKHYFWSETWGRRLLDTDLDEMPDGNYLEIALGPNDGEILVAESNGNGNDLILSQDGGNTWCILDWYPQECRNLSLPKAYNDIIPLISQWDYMDYSTIEYEPIWRDDIFTSVGENKIPKPFIINLSCYPNPFNAQTTISFSLERETHIKISIYDITGRLIEVITESSFSPGKHCIIWNAGDLPSGIYFANLKTTEVSITEKLVLLK